MAGVRCPFCQQIMSLSQATCQSHRVNFYNYFDDKRPYLEITIYHCPNSSCNKETIIATGRHGYIHNQQVMIYPTSNARILPSYIPASFRCDYEESCAILRQSPKAAATLARRCLQGMIRDFWGVNGKKNLYEEINAIKDKVPQAQWAAIDALRKVGNIGAHMEHDVDVIVDVDPDEAEKLILLIELLMDKWYIARHEEEELYQSITQTAKDKGELRRLHKEGH